VGQLTDTERRSVEKVAWFSPSVSRQFYRTDGWHCCVNAATAHVPPQGIHRRPHPGRPGRRWPPDADAEPDGRRRWRRRRRRGRSAVAVVVVSSFVHGQRQIAGPSAACLRAQRRQAVPRGFLAQLCQRQRTEPQARRVRVFRVSCFFFRLIFGKRRVQSESQSIPSSDA